MLQQHEATRSIEGTIIVGTKTYARSARGLTESLFSPVNGRTLDGYARTLRSGAVVLFHRPNGELFAAVVCNRGECFFVSAASCATTGRPYYMHGISEEARDYLGLSSLTYAERRALAHKVIHSQATK